MTSPSTGSNRSPSDPATDGIPGAAHETVAPLLTVGVPAFNEESTLHRCLGSALGNVTELPDPRQVEIVLVDDGSTDRTAAVASELIGDRGRVITQPNRGRAATRRVILDEARGEYVLMLDAHVDLAAGVLPWWLEAGRPSPMSGDLRTELSSPYAQFWDTLTTFGWRDYLTNRRDVDFGPEEFDRFPKGTGMFLARRATWLQAYQDSRLEDLADTATVSDDTRLLRALAERHRIRLRPEFRAVYFPPRSTLGQFVGNARYRGTTFVDSYWRSPSLVGRAVRGLPAASAVGLVSAAFVARRWRAGAGALAVAAAAAPSAAVAAMAFSTRLPPKQAAVSAAVAPVFAMAFGSGLVRGYLAKATEARSHSRTVATGEK